MSLVRDDFLKANETETAQYLLGLAHSIDQNWPPSPALVYKLRDALIWCQEHDNPRIREIGTLTRLLRETTFEYEHFLGILVYLERRYARNVADHDFLPQENDQPSLSTIPRQPLYVVCDNLRSAFNVGSIFRTADCFGVHKIYLCGYTATPDHPKTQKTTMGSHRVIEWEWHAHTLDTIKSLQAMGITVVALETVTNTPTIYREDWPSPCAILLGNERHGLSPHLIKAADQIRRIPLFGYKNSLNIGAAFAVTVSEIARQWHRGAALTE